MAEARDDERNAVAINPGMLRDEFVEFPGVLSDYGERYAEAISGAAAAKETLKDIEEDVYLELRMGADKLTEATLKAMVRKDRRVRMARQLWLEADAKETRFKHKVMDPLYAKKDMLISIGAHQRAEISGDPMVKHAKGAGYATDELERRAFGR